MDVFWHDKLLVSCSFNCFPVIVKHVIILFLSAYKHKVEVIGHEIFVSKPHTVCVLRDKSLPDEVFSNYTYAYLVQTRVTPQGKRISISGTYQIFMYPQHQVYIQFTPLMFSCFGQWLTVWLVRVHLPYVYWGIRWLAVLHVIKIK